MTEHPSSGNRTRDAFTLFRLMIALLSTAARGLVMSTIPDLGELRVLQADWGLTTVLPLWAFSDS